MDYAKDRLPVFVAEDSLPVRERIVAMLADIPNVDVVGQCASSSDAISGIRRELPACAVLDFSLEGGNALDVLRAVRRDAPDAVFLVLTNSVDPQYRLLCQRAGANGFFDKSNDFDKVADLVASLARQRAEPTETLTSA